MLNLVLHSKTDLYGQWRYDFRLGDPVMGISIPAVSAPFVGPPPVPIALSLVIDKQGENLPSFDFGVNYTLGELAQQ